MQVTGRITRILDKISGQKRDGSGTWEKQSFVVETNDNYNNIYCFEVFGADKVSSFNSQYEIGSDITVDFNISTNEYKDRYYTTLQAWKFNQSEFSD